MALDPNVMGWDDVLENDGQEYVILPEGDYTYTVTNFERGQFPGGKKLPPCPVKNAHILLIASSEYTTFG